MNIYFNIPTQTNHAEDLCDLSDTTKVRRPPSSDEISQPCRQIACLYGWHVTLIAQGVVPKSSLVRVSEGPHDSPCYRPSHARHLGLISGVTCRVIGEVKGRHPEWEV